MKNQQNFAWSKLPTRQIFQKEMSIPGKTANRLKLLDLVSTNVGFNPDINISAGDFISANYQHSQNLQTQYVDTLKQQKTRTEQKNFEQLSLKMWYKHKFAAYIDDNCLRLINFFYIFLCKRYQKAVLRTLSLSSFLKSDCKDSS